jgi:hypothetical protein
MDIIDKLTEFTQKEARGVSACTTVADIRRLVDAAGEDNALLQLGGRGDVLLLTLAIVSLTHNLQPPVLLHMMSLAQLLFGIEHGLEHTAGQQAFFQQLCVARAQVLRTIRDAPDRAFKANYRKHATTGCPTCHLRVLVQNLTVEQIEQMATTQYLPGAPLL